MGNEAHYLQYQDRCKYALVCSHMAFWGVFTKQEARAHRREASQVFFIQMKHSYTLYHSVVVTTSYNSELWTGSSRSLML